MTYVHKKIVVCLFILNFLMMNEEVISKESLKPRDCFWQALETFSWRGSLSLLSELTAAFSGCERAAGSVIHTAT